MNSARRRLLLQAWPCLQASALLPWCPALSGLLGLSKAHAQAPALGPDALPELFAHSDALFRSTQLEDCLSLLAGAAPLRTGAQANALVLEVPDMADNGAAVPVALRWQGGAVVKPGQNVELAILVDKNPLVLSLWVTLQSPCLPALKTRIKMNQSSEVCAFLKMDGRCYVVRKLVRVTLGGCVA